MKTNLWLTESRHGCLWLRGRNRKETKITKEQEKRLEVVIMFIILIVVTVSQVYTYVKIHQAVHFKINAVYYMSIIPQLICFLKVHEDDR